MKPIEAIIYGALFLGACGLLYWARGVTGLYFIGLIVLTVAIFAMVARFFGSVPAYVAIAPMFIVTAKLVTRWGWNR